MKATKIFDLCLLWPHIGFAVVACWRLIRFLPSLHSRSGKTSGDAKAYLTGIYNKVRDLNNTSYYGEDREGWF